MNAKSLSNLRAPRNRGLDRKTLAPPSRTRAQIGSGRVARSTATSERGAVSPADIIFIARAEARALLWQAGEFELQDAVDVLQASAEATGLIAEIGQDAVQAIIAKAFGAVQ